MQPVLFSTEYPTQLAASLWTREQRNVPPLLNVTKLRTRLLPPFAFDRLRHTAQHPAYKLPFGVQLEHPRTLSLNRAVHPFKSFISAACPGRLASTEATMPPLNVLMVRHTYPLV
jgi:hypothetical protein